MFDAVVASAPGREENPWCPAGACQAAPHPGLHAGLHPWPNPVVPPGLPPDFHPDEDTLTRLLGVPVALRATSQSGVPALALDVWLAYELRRAGFDADAVWPRAQPPRVLPTEILAFVDQLPPKEAAALRHRIATLGTGGSSAANLLGKNYVKQVDVVMTSWATGPELMISTKRMDSSFAKNAANRVEESYGDAKNLRLRHPQAALGFVFALAARAFETEPDTAAWIVDLLIKLGREDDAYDAVALVVPDVPPEAALLETDEPEPPEEAAASPTLTPAQDGPLRAGGIPVPGELELIGQDSDDGTLFGEPTPDLSQLRSVPLRHDVVPAELAPGRFLRIMCERVLDQSPVNFHRQARQRRSAGSAPG